MSSTPTSQETAATTGLSPEIAKEVEVLNLHPRRREILEEVLINTPELTVQAAVEMLEAAGW